jgi:predicted HD superfamily hydrolase involved in NAD metabolism
MVEYEKIYEDVKNALSEKRFRHTEGVIERAVEYAKIYNVDVEKAKYAALLHDVAKELSKEESYKILQEDKEILDFVEKNNFNLLHSNVGAIIAKNKYEMPDDIVSSIKYHTTGKENMTMLEKIIYLADATEKNRKYEISEELTMEELVNLIKTDIDKGLYYTLKWCIGDVLKKDKMLHLDSVKAYNFYNKIINEKNM